MNADKSRDGEVLSHLYAGVIASGQAPDALQTARALGAPADDVRAAYARLARRRLVSVEPELGALVALQPFSLVPTPFLVETAARAYFGSCAWCALGIAALLGCDARVRTGCGHCNAPLELSVAAGRLTRAEGIVHFALPAARWFDDLVFACKTILSFRAEAHVDAWCASWRQPRGELLAPQDVWTLAREFYSPERLQPDWRPPNSAASEAALARCGLTSAFWRFPARA